MKTRIAHRFRLWHEAAGGCEGPWLDCENLEISEDGHGITFWVINGEWAGTLYPNGLMVIHGHSGWGVSGVPMAHPAWCLDLREGHTFQYWSEEVGDHHSYDLDDEIPF